MLGIPLGSREPLPFSDYERHLFIVGQTGSGKSTLIENLLADLMYRGEGVCLIDPHGDIAKSVLYSIPLERRHDLIYLSPHSPVGLNFIQDIPQEDRPRAAEMIVSAMRHVWKDTWGARMEYILYNSIRVLMDAPNRTLLDIPKLLMDKRTRKSVLKHCLDPVISYFWEEEYEMMNDRLRSEAISPIQNKIGRILATPNLRDIICQPNTVNIRQAMDDRKIVVVNLSKGFLGETPAHLLGALLVTAMTDAALSRVDQDEEVRIPFHLFVDEFHNFATDSFASIMSEARKYKLSLYLATQYMFQVTETIQEAIWGNVGTLCAFRVGASDAPVLTKQFDGQREQSFIEMPNYEYWMRGLVKGTPNTMVRMKSLPPPEPLHQNSQLLLQTSLKNWGV